MNHCGHTAVTSTLSSRRWQQYHISPKAPPPLGDDAMDRSYHCRCSSLTLHSQLSLPPFPNSITITVGQIATRGLYVSPPTHPLPAPPPPWLRSITTQPLSFTFSPLLLNSHLPLPPPFCSVNLFYSPSPCAVEATLKGSPPAAQLPSSAILLFFPFVLLYFASNCSPFESRAVLLPSCGHLGPLSAHLLFCVFFAISPVCITPFLWIPVHGLELQSF